MTDEQIVKALECCSLIQGECKECPCDCVMDCDCKEMLLREAFYLINRQKARIKEFDEKIVMQMGLIEHQKAEIERLQCSAKRHGKRLGSLIHHLETAKSEAYKEFAERFKEKASSAVTSCQGYEIYETKQYQISAVGLDNLLKELTESK